MKTLKKGRAQKGWAKEVRCTGVGNGQGGCGALLLVEEGDLYKTFRHCYGDSSPDVYTTFTCQECGVETDIKDVPNNITDKLVSKKEYKEQKEKQ